METTDLEKQIIQYYKSRNLEIPNLYCKECGKLLIYDNAHITFTTIDGKKYSKGEIKAQGLTFLSTRDYDGKIYHLCRCKECVAKKYPKILKAKYPYGMKAAFSTAYAFDVPDNIFRKYTKERQGITKEKMIKTYGEVEGLQHWKKYCNLQSVTNTFEYKQKKYGMTRTEFDEFNKSRACTLELFKQRHGDEKGQKLWDDYCEKQRYTTSLNYFIEKYGAIEGEQRYKIFDHERITFGGASKMANDFFDLLYQNEYINKHQVFYNRLNYEYDILGYRVDFYDATSNVVIEFFGDKWHANPEKYKSTDYIVCPLDKNVSNMAQSIWDRDNYRKNRIVEYLHCTFIIVWESDIKYKNQKNETIAKIINIIKNKENINENTNK